MNFKTYAVGRLGEELALACERAALATNKSVAICVSAADLNRISRLVSIPVFCEHMDPDERGSHTGKIIAEDILDNGGVGTLLNHSEDRYRMDVLEQAIIRAKKAGLVSCVCANNSEIAEAISAWEPDMIAVEPPELIGGNVSVSSARPEVISETVEKVHRIAPGTPVLCGAGVKTREDVRRALNLGARGVLLASGVTKADDPFKVLRDLAEGL